MILFQALACFLLLLPANVLGLYITPTCLLRLCYSDLPDPCNSPLPADLRVTNKDVHGLGHLVSLISSTSSFTPPGTTACTCSDIYQYRKLIGCNCGFTAPNENSTKPNYRVCRVTYIDFSNMGLRGTLPEHIDSLDVVTYLDLSGNWLSGSIPATILSLTQLTYLDLCNNKFEGRIPPFSRNHTALKSLYLCSNQLSGSIPKEFGELPSLVNLYLRFNKLEGTIPDQIWNIKTLVQLELQDNQSMEGQISEQIGNLENLEALVLMNNNFSGKLPTSIRKLTNLRSLQVQGSNLNGIIPDVLSQLPNLTTLMLIGNKFEGPLPKVFSAKTLVYLSITDVFDSKTGSRFPDIKALTNLQTMILRNCSLIGPIPSEIWKLQKLIELDLSFNKLTGEIPPELSLKSVTKIYLRSNELSGALPEWVTLPWNSAGPRSVRALQPPMALICDVSENRFTSTAVFPNSSAFTDKNLFGCCSTDDVEKKWLSNTYHCPSEMATNDHLYINCGGNETVINGHTYEADLDENGKSTFFLSDNSAWGYSSMGAFVYAQNAKYVVNQTCNISMVDAPLYTGARVAPISLKYFGFCLRNDTYTVTLHFAEIGWGMDSFNIEGKRIFNVEIQGKKELENFNIEEEIGGVNRDLTRAFNTSVTNNRLEIHLYWAGKGSMFAPKQYGPLISAISVSAVPKKRRKLSSTVIGAITGSSVAFVGLILALLWMLGLLGGKKRNKEGVELYPGGFYKFEQIRDATNNFSPENQIGVSGSVYKGKLKDERISKHKDIEEEGKLKDERISKHKDIEEEGKLKDESVTKHKDENEEKVKDHIDIAVKKLSAKTKQGVLKILQEIGLVYTLEHPNIAKPMGCCTKDRQVLIVYKFMENISLQYALFGPNNDEVKSKLNWKIRSKICLGMAKGLVFLHEESQLGIIHSNIKPTNILLDREFNVKISDFGYSELHDDGVNEEGVLNTPRAKDTGHMAPEYMQGHHLTPKSDVYSFGLVTLELLSGQPHILNKTKEDVYLINKAYTCYAKNDLEALIDGSLGRYPDYKHPEAVCMLHLAMQCVSPGFDLRPTMSEVVQILEGKKKLSKKQIHALATVEPVVASSPSSDSQQVRNVPDEIDIV